MITDFDLNHLMDSLSLKEPITKKFLEISLENAILFDKKQQDYGPKNISGFGTFGVIVRMNDKFERLKTGFKQASNGGVMKMNNESLEDTFRDLSNYSIIAHLLHKDLWPK